MSLINEALKKAQKASETGTSAPSAPPVFKGVLNPSPGHSKWTIARSIFAGIIAVSVLSSAVLFFLFGVLDFDGRGESPGAAGDPSPRQAGSFPAEGVEVTLVDKAPPKFPRSGEAAPELQFGEKVESGEATQQPQVVIGPEAVAAALAKVFPQGEPPAAPASATPTEEPAEAEPEAERPAPEPAEPVAEASKPPRTTPPVETFAAEEKANAAIAQFIDELKVPAVRQHPAGNKVLMLDRVFAEGDTVNYDLGLKVVTIQLNKLVFEDDAGNIYIKSF